MEKRVHRGNRTFGVVRHRRQRFCLILRGIRFYAQNKRWDSISSDGVVRPPADATNALLSFAYSLLTADLMSAIQTVGLDPYIGFFHQLKYGKPCLALDLMEEFRPIISDSVVITLINNRRIKPEDFTQSHGGWYLKDHRRKVFYAAYETHERMRRSRILYLSIS